MLRTCSLVLCLCFALAAPATVFADATARVLSVTPGVRYSLGNAGEALAVKMDVPIKAVVVSDATGKAQLMFPDDSTLSIAPDTQISLAEYVDVEHEENIVLDLVSGTARIITGESNRKNPQAFTVNTPQASIGIRGTLVTIQAGGGVTRVYLTETSGKGVSVRNLGTGQVMELRKPGTIINVGANFMEERKAQKEEAASFSAALRGKSRAAIQAATAQAEMQRLKKARGSLATVGTLPPASLGDPVQVAALDRSDLLTRPTLVAENTPAVVPAIAPVVVPNVPDVKPATPEVPNAPDPILPEPPVQDYVITDFAQVAGLDFTGTGTFDFYIDDIFIRTDTGEEQITFPNYSEENYTFANDVYTIKMFWVGLPLLDKQNDGTYKVMTAMDFQNQPLQLNTDGNFVTEATDIRDGVKYGAVTIKGKLIGPKEGIINELYGYQNFTSKNSSILKGSMTITGR